MLRETPAHHRHLHLVGFGWMSIRFAAALLILIGIIDKYAFFSHLKDVGWNVISISRWLPVIGIAGASILMIITWRQKLKWYFWIVPVSWLVTEVMLFFILWIRPIIIGGTL